MTPSPSPLTVCLALLLCSPGLAQAAWPLRTADPLVQAPLASPRAGQWSVALEYQRASALTHGSDPRLLEGISQDEARATGTFSPAQHLTLVLSLPVVWRTFSTEGAGRPSFTTQEAAVGDALLGARIWVYRLTTAEGVQRGGAAVEAGAELPTGPGALLDRSGFKLPEHGQIGGATFAPFIGPLWADRLGRLSYDASLTLHFPLISDNRYIPGMRARLNAGAEWLFWDRLAVRAGLFTQLWQRDSLYGRSAFGSDDPGKLAPIEGTGGLQLALAPAARVRLFEGLWLQARVDLPVLTAFSSLQRWSPTVWTSLSYQLK